MSSPHESRPYPDTCPSCGETGPGPEHWKWNPHKRAKFGGTWRCREAVRALGRDYGKRRRADPDRSAAHRQQSAEYAKANSRYMRYKSYRHIDNKKYNGNTLPWEEANILMSQPCTYCGLAISEGLDRIDNTLGHSSGNVVPCCKVCNGILLDLPEGVKKNLAQGLRTSREEGLLDTWLPPQLRK